MTENKSVTVETVEVTIEVGKETKEVADAIHDLIVDIKEGKDITAITAENLSGLMKAIEGFDKLDDEQKHKTRNATDAYAAMKLTDALIPVK